MKTSRLVPSFGLAAGCSAALAWVCGLPAFAAVASAVEPGLEKAVDWKWRVLAAEVDSWGVPIEEKGTPGGAGGGGMAERPAEYEVKKGDALAKIAKRFDMSVWQLKKFNGMETDRIVIGQKLRIPNAVELLKLVPPPPPPAPEPAGGRKKKPAKAVPEPPMPEEPGLMEDELDNVRLQVFLDRQMYSPGMIDGKDGPVFRKLCEIYQKNNPDAGDMMKLRAKAQTAVADPFTSYLLRVEDFRFIQVSKPGPEPAEKKAPAAKSRSGKGASAPVAAVSPAGIDRLLEKKFLSYQNSWEFVAERFHCDESFLRGINPMIKGDPVAGMEIKVPAVEPFEIEKALDGNLQPEPDPANPVVAAIVLVQRLEIWRGGRLIAVMPVASARPGLCGRGSWTVMDAVPRPMLATRRELREPPKPPVAPLSDGAAAGAAPGVNPVASTGVEEPLDHEQQLAAGPNNPVGVCWVHLAKQGGKEPLPYGLHGTSIPGRMRTQQGLGGFRLTNWDIVRAVKLIPKGTALQWRAR